MSAIWIGLTGGPGCGKSETGRIFSRFPGWQHYDTDQICHEIYSERDSPLVKLLEARWGRSVRSETGQPDRKVIAEKVFDNENEREWLNSILHPEIFFRLETRAAETRAEFVLIETPLLFETRWNIKMRKNIAVWSPSELQMQRLLARGWTCEHAEKRIAAQFSADKKLELADYGIINRGSLESLQEQCCRIESEIRLFFNQ
ncbi:MAG: dephospho-CoA kinase [Lentisphaeria bacterium]|nr:dephospho-CoA kinase [Lentisphaeria bacterium]